MFAKVTLHPGASKDNLLERAREPAGCKGEKPEALREDATKIQVQEGTVTLKEPDLGFWELMQLMFSACSQPAKFMLLLASV